MKMSLRLKCLWKLFRSCVFLGVCVCGKERDSIEGSLPLYTLLFPLVYAMLFLQHSLVDRLTLRHPSVRPVQASRTQKPAKDAPTSLIRTSDFLRDNPSSARSGGTLRMASHQLATVSSFFFWRDSIESYSEQGDSSGKSVIIWAEGGGLEAVNEHL